jgi:hypothetical protein
MARVDQTMEMSQNGVRPMLPCQARIRDVAPPHRVQGMVWVRLPHTA